MITIPEWLVGAFFGALATGFLTIAALTAASRYVKRQEKNQ